MIPASYNSHRSKGQSQKPGFSKEEINLNMYKKVKPPVSREFGKEIVNYPNYLTINLRKPRGDSKNKLAKPVQDSGLNNPRPRPRASSNYNNDTNIPKMHSANTSFSNNENYNTLNISHDKMDVDSERLNTSIHPTTSQAQTEYASTQEILFKSSHKKTIDNKFQSLNVSKNNPQVVQEYLEDIYDYLKDVEKSNLPNYGYMKTQPDINEKMRAILIDWLVDVHLKFKLTPETLFLTVNIIDRYLEKNQIQRSKLQLVGVSSLFIACKYEEIYPPELKDFVYITDKAYTKEEIIETETKILRFLEFSITSPSHFRFLEIYFELSQLKNEDPQLVLFAQYLLELSLVEYRMLKYPPSWVAGASLYIAMKIKKITTNKKLDIPKLCGYTDEKLKECAKHICLILDNADKNTLKAVKNKFSSDKFLKVAIWRK